MVVVIAFPFFKRGFQAAMGSEDKEPYEHKKRIARVGSKARAKILLQRAWMSLAAWAGGSGRSVEGASEVP